MGITCERYKEIYTFNAHLFQLPLSNILFQY